MADIKIKNNKTFNDFKSILSTGASAEDLEAFTQIMELPDAEFDKFYPLMKEKLNETYGSSGYEAEILESLKKELKRNPNFNIEEEAAAAREFIKTLDDEEGMSANKKEFLASIFENSILKFSELYQNPREKIHVKIEKLDENAKLPTYAHPTDAGADVYALEETTINPGETKTVRTGIKVAIPKGYEITIRPRSGLSLKTGLRIANSPATIDSDYRGEVMIILWNSGASPYTINAGDKIAQMLIAAVPMIVWDEEAITDTTERGEGGFGSSGN